MGYNDILLYENPRRGGRRHSRRNPASAIALPKSLQRFIPASLSDIAAATGGLAASTMIPAMIVKDTSTVWKKLAKVGVSILSASLAAAIASRIMKGSAKAALLGGLAGTGGMTLAMFTKYQIGGGQRRMVSGTRTLNLGESRVTRSDANDSGIQISVT